METEDRSNFSDEAWIAHLEQENKELRENERLHYLRGLRDGHQDYSKLSYTDSDIRDWIEELEELEQVLNKEQ